MLRNNSRKQVRSIFIWIETVCTEILFKTRSSDICNFSVAVQMVVLGRDVKRCDIG